MTALLLAGCWACCRLDALAMRLPDSVPSPSRSPIAASYSFTISHAGDTRISATTGISSKKFSASRITSTTAVPSRKFSAPRWNPVANERRKLVTTSPLPQTTAAPETPVPETPTQEVQIIDGSHAEVPVLEVNADDNVPLSIPKLPNTDASTSTTSVPHILSTNVRVADVPVSESPMSPFPYYEYIDEDNEPQNAATSVPLPNDNKEKLSRYQNLVQLADTPGSETLSPILYRQAEYSFKTVYGGR